MGIIKSFLLGGCRQFVAATKRKPNIIRACVCAEHSNRYNCIYVFMHVAGRQFEKKKTIVTEHWSQHAATTAATSTDNSKHGIMRHKVPLECPGPWPKPMPMPISIPSAIRIPIFIPLPKTSCHSPFFFRGERFSLLGNCLAVAKHPGKHSANNVGRRDGRTPAFGQMNCKCTGTRLSQQLGSRACPQSEQPLEGGFLVMAKRQMLVSSFGNIICKKKSFELMLSYFAVIKNYSSICKLNFKNIY